MTQAWYHIAQTPEGTHIHRLHPAAAEARASAMADFRRIEYDSAVAEVMGEYAQAIRDSLGFPQDWVNVDKYSSSISQGEPHPRTMELATVHDDLPELPEVPQR